MTKGTITNKTTGDVLHVVSYDDENLESGFYARVIGEVVRRLFRHDFWTYEEERKPLQDQINELPMGTLFWLGVNSEFRYMKTGENAIQAFFDGRYEGEYSVPDFASSNDQPGYNVSVLDWSEFK